MFRPPTQLRQLFWCVVQDCGGFSPLLFSSFCQYRKSQGNQSQALVGCSLNAVTFPCWRAKESPVLRFLAPLFHIAGISSHLLHPSDIFWGFHCRQTDLAVFREVTASMRNEDISLGHLPAHFQHRKGFARRQSVHTLAQLPLAANCPAKRLPQGFSAFSMPWPLLWTQKKFSDLSSHISQKKEGRGEVFNPLLQAVAQRLRDLELGHLHYFVNSIFNTAELVVVTRTALLCKMLPESAA